ncbi:uncharacterized protein LOC121392725 isoform X2 [Gigantopelta aegis]|uniref:uncharacterized protein LOC121392725 isoform X2 n=1 Tax=Gigantopelta aegis TaxID=1735272 RepID=UPI001B88BBA7|nr:uncharacterized protein LOC121392725 isoform X2 [Gigantopelta aegis]
MNNLKIARSTEVSLLKTNLDSKLLKLRIYVNDLHFYLAKLARKCPHCRTEIIVGCVVGGIVVLTFVVIAACCYYARFARPRRIARIRRATIMVPSTVYHTRAQHEIIGDGQHHARENAMQLPPPYEVVIENSKTQDKPPSYDDVIKDDSSTALKNNETSYR